MTNPKFIYFFMYGGGAIAAKDNLKALHESAERTMRKAGEKAPFPSYSTVQKGIKSDRKRYTWQIQIGPLVKGGDAIQIEAGIYKVLLD